jgi:hypothetical protein
MIIVNPFTGMSLNADVPNPEGCNQHTGPNCKGLFSKMAEEQKPTGIKSTEAKVGDMKPGARKVGTKVKLTTPYRVGFNDDGSPKLATEGTITEPIGRNWAGIPMYGLEIEGYSYKGDPITVDFAESEFDDEWGEAYKEKFLKELGRDQE